MSKYRIIKQLSLHGTHIQYVVQKCLPDDTVYLDVEGQFTNCDCPIEQYTAEALYAKHVSFAEIKASEKGFTIVKGDADTPVKLRVVKKSTKVAKKK